MIWTTFNINGFWLRHVLKKKDLQMDIQIEYILPKPRWNI